MSWTCPRCKTENEDQQYECEHCWFRNPFEDEGSNRWNDWRCDHCGATNSGGWKDCGECGSRRKPR
jgi:hypothetical protein